MEKFECEICGDETTAEHDHSSEAVVVRDGARGIFLAQTFIEDASELLELDLPEGFEDWRTKNVHEEDTGKEDPEAEMWEVGRLEGLLAEAGFQSFWEDGYVIYNLKKQAS